MSRRFASTQSGDEILFFVIGIFPSDADGWRTNGLRKARRPPASDQREKRMRCYFLRDGRIGSTEMVTEASDEAAIEQGHALLKSRHSKSDGFEIWDYSRFVYRYLPEYRTRRRSDPGRPQQTQTTDPQNEHAVDMADVLAKAPAKGADEIEEK